MSVAQGLARRKDRFFIATSSNVPPQVLIYVDLSNTRPAGYSLAMWKQRKALIDLIGSRQQALAQCLHAKDRRHSFDLGRRLPVKWQCVKTLSPW